MECQKIKDEEQRDKAITELKASVQERMKGTLFENDTTQSDNITEPMKKKTNVQKLKNKRKPPNEEQSTLF
ncbi:MAG: hypothetical protein AAGG68_31050 [Bacteroidota bacterium]